MAAALAPTLVPLRTAPDLVEQVRQAVQNAICDGSLAPGQRITQEELAAMLAVSRQPVLQALRLLKADGFVEDAPGRGVRVVPLEPHTVLQLYEVRGALDALAARGAASRRAMLDPALLTRGRKAAGGRSVQAMIEADLAFHEAIYTASGNPLIAQAAQPHWRHLRRVMGAVLQHSQQRDAVWAEHEAIATAIAAGRGGEAARLIEQHAAHASQHLAERLAHVLHTANGDTA
jgi:DNA-binding GntR family transcriptional regulator